MFSCRIFDLAGDIILDMTTNDLELLEQYATHGSEDAFAELAHRHLDLVYCAALRQVRSPELAQEVAQSVFADLARSAGRMKPDTVLTAWLYQVARRTAVDVVRRESRRQLRERLAVELADMNTHPSIWKRIEPLLEEAMERLEPAERTAILLRFFENRNLREVGQTLGTSEDAAQKRVSRAVDKLREFLFQRGVAVGTGGLALALSTNAVQSAPPGLAATISSITALPGGALHAVTTAGTTKALAMTTLQKIAITAIITATVGAGYYESRQAARAREQLETLQQSQAPLKEQLGRLAQERDDATKQLASVRGENEDLRASLADLPRLRGEVARLRDNAREQAQLKTGADTASNDPAMDSALKTWAARAARLRQRLDQAPEMRIPELQFLNEKGWLDAVTTLKQLDTDEDYRLAASNLRNIAKNEFGHLLQKALRGFTDANNGQLPQDLGQLKPFFSQPVDDAVLQRYKLLQSGALGDASGYLIADIAPLIDEEHDATYQFSLNGTNSHTGDPTEDAVKEAGTQYAENHNGLLPTDASQLAPYLKKPIAPDKVQSVLNKIPAGITTLQQLKAVMH
jgi:RNA polymerase sigma factor (sigma-70 family)